MPVSQENGQVPHNTYILYQAKAVVMFPMSSFFMSRPSHFSSPRTSNLIFLNTGLSIELRIRNS